MSYAAAIQSLYELAGELQSKPGEARRKFRLEDMRVLLDGLGNPERRFPAVLIAGTNGKGSTAATLASILTAAGYRTGLYTSPHLEQVNERVRIGKAWIRDDAFARCYFRVEEVAARLVGDGRLPAPPSFFETMTALAFLYFAEEKVELAVLEVGMGGRLDATNVVEPLVSVVTDISLDHTEWLGSTIAEIAQEKAGILRASGVMVTLPQHAEANRALGETAVALGVRGVNAAEYLPARSPEERSTENHYKLQLGAETLEVQSPLAGVHQQRNLALAIATALELRNNHGYTIETAAIAEGIRETKWAGRLERFPVEEAEVLLDVAHNPAGAWALRSALSGEGRRLPVLIFGCLKDKPVRELAQILFPLFERVLLTPVGSPRAATLEEMIAAAEMVGAVYETHATVEEALRAALLGTKRPGDASVDSGLVVGTGSVYLVGKLRELLTRGGVHP